MKTWFQTFAVFWMSYSFFWVISRALNFMYRHFRTLCQLHLHWWCKLHRLWSVPKRRYIQFNRRGITQKKVYKFIKNAVLDRNIQWHASIRWHWSMYWNLQFRFPWGTLGCNIWSAKRFSGGICSFEWEILGIIFDSYNESQRDALFLKVIW